ncbi:MAG: hypothetical protein ABFD89_24385 [Bryobacteraceae bacterium]
MPENQGPISSYAGVGESDAYTLKRLESTTLGPPVLRGLRVPYARGMRVAATSTFLGGTAFQVVFQEAIIDPSLVDRYEIYASNLIDANTEPVLVGAARHSPIVCRVTADAVRNIVLRIRTVLKNGMANEIFDGPSCSATTIAPTTGAGDLPTGVRGEVWIFGAGGAFDTVGPGEVDEFLVGAGAAADPVFKTAQTLKLGQFRVVSKTTDFAPDNVYDVYLIDTSGGDVTVTLPAATGRTTPYHFKKTTSDVNDIILDPNGADNIEGVNANWSFNGDRQSIMLLPVSGNWWIL